MSDALLGLEPTDVAAVTGFLDQAVSSLVSSIKQGAGCQTPQQVASAERLCYHAQQISYLIRGLCEEPDSEALEWILSPRLWAALLQAVGNDRVAAVRYAIEAVYLALRLGLSLADLVHDGSEVDQ